MSSSREDVIAANSYVYNHYHDGKEANYFLSTDRINALAVLPPNKATTSLLLLVCVRPIIIHEGWERKRFPR